MSTSNQVTNGSSTGSTAGQSPSASNAGDRRQKFVLVVEDDSDIASTFAFGLRHQGYDVAVAGNGNDAIAMIETCSPDLMVLDLMLPKRSGFLVLEHLRQTGAGTMPVVVVTANEGARHREYVEILGIDDYFCKPVQMPELLKSIGRLV